MTLAFDGRVDLGRFSLDASFTCLPGETIALVGPNGSGKSTALSALAGLRRLTGGTIEIDGQLVDGPGHWVPPHQRSVGTVFQDLLLFPHLSALDNVAYGLRRRGRAKKAARASAIEALERFGVAELGEARTRSLSGGQAQRVALARALVNEPKVLLLDEPLSALDAETRLHVRCELHRHLLAMQGYAVLVAHDVVDVLVLADRVVVLDEGRVAQIGTPAELERRPATRFAAAFVGTNLVRAMRHGDTVELAPGVRLPVSAGGSDGPVDLVVSPRHVRVSAGRTNPAEHEWLATIAGIEAAGDDVHVRLSTPVPIAARASFEAVRGLDLVPGAQVLVHVDLDAVTVHDTPSPFLPTPT